MLHNILPLTALPPPRVFNTKGKNEHVKFVPFGHACHVLLQVPTASWFTLFLFSLLLSSVISTFLSMTCPAPWPPSPVPPPPWWPSFQSLVATAGPHFTVLPSPKASSVVLSSLQPGPSQLPTAPPSSLLMSPFFVLSGSSHFFIAHSLISLFGLHLQHTHIHMHMHTSRRPTRPSLPVSFLPSVSTPMN